MSRHFLDIEPEFRRREDAAVEIVPVPYDATSSWAKGADRGPAAILAASAHLEHYDIETVSEPFRKGIYTAVPMVPGSRPEQLVAAVEKRIGAVIDDGRLPVVLGGNHTVSIGAIRAAAQRFDDLSVLQIDAHADTRDTYQGSPFNHACVMARAREACPIVQVGVRSIAACELAAVDPQRMFWAEALRGGDDHWMSAVAERLSERVYVTIDVDAFDPSVMPATGTPEPGGLSWRQVNALLGAVTGRRRVVGFDVVELLPQPGQHACDFLAAKLVYRFLAMIFAAAQQSRT